LAGVAGHGDGKIAEYLQYTLFLVLALNINAGISPDSECPKLERPAPRPIIACGPSAQTRPQFKHPRLNKGGPNIILIDGAGK
jgi:hypothetical protein